METRFYGLFLTGLLGLFSLGKSLDITGNPPVLVIVNDAANANPQLAQFRDNLNITLAKSFTSTLDTAKKNLSKYKQQKDLAQGFANANAYSMNSATLQGFQNYSLFAVATGLMVGVQAPSTSLSYYSKIGDEITRKGDVYAGLGIGITYLNVGINAGFLMPGLYANAKYGGAKYSRKGFGMDFQMMGMGLNYRLLDTKSLVGLIKWRGISIGSGLYMQKDKINFLIKADTIQNAIPFGKDLLGAATSSSDSTARKVFLDQLGFTNDPGINLIPSFNMGQEVSTVTIPFDAVTAVSVLWGLINVTAGVGFDMNFGSNKIVLEGLAKATIKTDTTKAKFNPADVKIDGSSSNGPSFARLRVMSGLGVGVGPVKLDIPVMYYVSSGLAIGLTVAVVW